MHDVPGRDVCGQRTVPSDISHKTHFSVFHCHESVPCLLQGLRMLQVLHAWKIFSRQWLVALRTKSSL